MDAKNNKKLINPTSNKIQISAKRDPGFYVFLSKLFLMDFNEIELHALGDAITIGVKVGELLTRNGYTDIGRIETTTISENDKETPEGEDRPRRGKKAKLIIRLTKSSRFPELIKGFKIQKS